jgi:hypothetical protein
MGGQFQHHFSPESAVVRDLENKLADSTANLAQRYQQLRQDPSVVLALRYLTLAVIASELNLYREHRSAAILVDEISQQMNSTDPNQLLTSIRYLKLRHQVVYGLNPTWFDRAAASAVDCINYAVASSKNSPQLALPPSASFDFEERVSGSRLRFDPENPPTKVRSFSWSRLILTTCALFGSGLSIGLIFNLDQFKFPQLAWATTSPPDDQAPVIASLPSPVPTTVADLPLPVLVESNRSAKADATQTRSVSSGESVSPIPTVMGMSKPLPATTTAQPTKDTSHFITSQLSAPFYQKVVSPETTAQPLVLNAQQKNPVSWGSASLMEQRLQKVCRGELQICSYGLKKQTMIVTLLPNYTNKIQQVAKEAAAQNDSAASIALDHHIQSLNDALASIGQNGMVTLELYGSNGKLLQRYLPKKSQAATKSH